MKKPQLKVWIAIILFQPVSHEYVRKYIETLSESKATGNDNISARLLKKACLAIIDPITHIINLSLKTGNVSKKLEESESKSYLQRYR